MKAKTHPAVLTALLAIALAVASEAAAICGRVERSGAAWLTGVRSAATRELATFIVKSATHAAARGAKS